MTPDMPVFSENLRSEARSPRRSSGGTFDPRVEAQAQKVIFDFHARTGSWERAAGELKTSTGYLFLVAHGKRRPSRRLLLALGVVKPERRYGIRVRLSAADARRIMAGEVPASVRARVAGAVAAKECGTDAY